MKREVVVILEISRAIFFFLGKHILSNALFLQVGVSFWFMLT